MKNDDLAGWIDVISQSSKTEYPFGYSRYQMDCIIGSAQDIQRASTQLNMIWHNRKSFKSDIDVAEVISNKVKEIKKSIEYFEGYLEPSEEESSE